MPGLAVVRPADANETSVLWGEILRRAEPVGLCLSRQNVPTQDRTVYAAAGNATKGAYVLAEAGDGEDEATPDVIIIATGSEVSVALEARELLQKSGIATRVVSMPCREWFEEQSPAYRRKVLPPEVRARVSIEAAASLGWRDYVGDAGEIIAIDHFGASADAATLFREFGFTPEAVVKAVRKSLQSAGADVAPQGRKAGSARTDTTPRGKAAKKAAEGRS